MKKLFSIMLSCMLLASGIPALAEATDTSADTDTTPAGETVSLGDSERVIPFLATTEIGGAAGYLGSLDKETSPYFPAFDWFTAQSSDTLTILSGVRTYQQTTESTCGPASALIAYDYLGGDTSALDDVTLSTMRQKDTELGATSLSMMQNIFSALGWEYTSTLTQGLTADDALEPPFLYKYIDAGFPVMVGWMEWGGHWTVLIGYDTMGTDSYYDDILIMADPYDTFDHMQDGYDVISADPFLYQWNLNMDVIDTAEAYAPFIVAYPPEMADKLPE